MLMLSFKNETNLKTLEMWNHVESGYLLNVIVRVESGYLLNAYCPYVKGEHMYTDLNNIGLS